jgi:hypothetical protein
MLGPARRVPSCVLQHPTVVCLLVQCVLSPLHGDTHVKAIEGRRREKGRGAGGRLQNNHNVPCSVGEKSSNHHSTTLRWRDGGGGGIFLVPAATYQHRHETSRRHNTHTHKNTRAFLSERQQRGVKKKQATTTTGQLLHESAQLQAIHAAHGLFRSFILQQKRFRPMDIAWTGQCSVRIAIRDASAGQNTHTHTREGMIAATKLT